MRFVTVTAGWSKLVPAQLGLWSWNLCEFKAARIDLMCNSAKPPYD